MFPSYSGINIGINNKEISRKFSNICKLNNILKNIKSQKGNNILVIFRIE